MTHSHAGHDHGPHEHDAHAHAENAHDGHRHSPNAASKALLIAVVLTAMFGAVEIVGSFWSGSLALLADAGHMATDAASLLFALIASIVARRPASDRHSFGLARTEVVAAFVNSLAMLAIVVWLFYEAIDRLRNPVNVQGGTVFVIASIGLVVNLVVAWMLSRDTDNINMRAALIHVLGDLLGSVAAIAAGVIIYFTGFMPIDPLLSILVGGLILRSTIGMLKETTLVLLDSVPEHLKYRSIGESLAHVPGVISVHDLHVWAMVPGKCAVAAHLLVKDAQQWPAILQACRALLMKDYRIEHITLQPEWLRADAPEVIPIIVVRG